MRLLVIFIASIMVFSVARESIVFATDSPHSGMNVGLFHLWEDTADVLEPNHGIISSSKVGIAISRHAEASVGPTLIVTRTPNVNVKIRLYKNLSNTLSLKMGGLVLLPNSENSFIFSEYASSIRNPFNTLFYLPISLHYSFSFKRRLKLHFSATQLTQYSPKNHSLNRSTAFTNILELAPGNHGSVAIHTGMFGIASPQPFTTYLGFSARYKWKQAFFHLGYYFLKNPSGLLTFPLANIGFIY